MCINKNIDIESHGERAGINEVLWEPECMRRNPETKMYGLSRVLHDL